MKERIRQLMESMHMNQQTFANHIQLSTATLSSILLGRTKPTLNTVEAIQKHCPTVNLGWLMNGQGDMYVTSDTSITADDELSSSDTVSGNINNVGGNMDLFSSFDDASQPGRPAPSSPVGSSSDSYNHSSHPNLRGYSASGMAGSAITGNSGGMTSQQRSARSQVQNFGVDMKNIDKYTRHITEIRVYYDDQTWETFVPKK